MSMDQIEGLEPIHENWGDVNLGEELDEGGDPPRIWSPFGEYPGTAFTRSMGDMIAEELGVTADPEIIHRRIHSGDRFIVIASDGVFEFLTNQSVADMVARYRDPLDACKKVVQEAYDLWLRYEVRTDDITIICVFLEGLQAGERGAGNSGAGDDDLDRIALEGIRPVRREMSRQRHRQLITGSEMYGGKNVSPQHYDLGASNDEEHYRVEDHYVPKSEEEKQSILSAIECNFLFEHITDQQRQVLVDAMRRSTVKKGDWVIKQGDKGDRFYVVDKGKFEVRVKDEEVVQDPADLGMLVHVYEPTETIKPCFGHLALLYSKPRSASVVAATDGVLWELDRPVFRRIMVKKSRREVAHTLRRVEILKTLNLMQLQKLCNVMTEETFMDGEFIVRQGEVGDVFYIIEEGTALVTQEMKGEVKELPTMKLKEYSYFGERALLTAEHHSVNVIAENEVKCLLLSQKAFEGVLGPLSAIINDDRRQREHNIGVPELQVLHLLGEVGRDNLGQTNVCSVPGKNSTYTLRTMWKSDVVAQQQRSMILKASEINKHVSEATGMHKRCVSLPKLVGTYNMETSLHMLHHVAAVKTLSALLEEEGALSAETVRHLTACIVLGLEALHKCDVLYRALSPELVHIDNRGYVALMEYRLAKIGLDNAGTLCGTPEYLAPEQVRHQGHSRAVDFWGLGVLIYELSHGKSPFAAESEMNVYNKISAHRGGELVYPTSFSPALCDLLDRLLHHDPRERLGANAGDVNKIKTHQWFAGFDWGGVQQGESFDEDLRHACHDKIHQILRTDGELPGEGKDYSGDQAIWDRF
ncbi:unnamed protein product [Discosporangium mesarthrocarpum]